MSYGDHTKFRQSNLLLIGCVSFLIGLALARRLAWSNPPVLSISLLIVLVCWHKRSVASLLAVLALGVLLGLWRGHSYMMHLAEYQKLWRQPITVMATADNDAIYGKQAQLSFDVVQVELVKPRRLSLTGKIKVEGFGAPMVYRGDLLQVQGSLSATQGSAQAKFSFAKIRLVKRGGEFTNALRRRFIAGLESVLPEPEASFGAGLLLGQRSTIPKDINDQLSATGLTHLVAVSGYNLTIIIMTVRQVLGRASKFQSTMAAGGLMLLFVLLTGLSASIVRAALVSSLSLLAWYYGRQFKPLLLIAISAATTTFWNPFYLWSDIGWYLSFLAFFGVLVISPLLAKLISRDRSPKLIGALLAETTGAQIMTLPIIMYVFGRVSVIGLLANVLVVPLVPAAMLLTLLAGVGGMSQPLVGGWLAWPARWLLTYMIDLVGLLSRLPHAALQRSIDLSTMLVSYGLILVTTIILGHSLRTKDQIMIK